MEEEVAWWRGFVQVDQRGRATSFGFRMSDVLF